MAYAPSAGYEEVLDAWKKYYSGFGIQVSIDDIIVTTGGSEAILFSLMTIADPGDEVIIFEPFYTNYLSFAKMAGVVIKPVSLNADEQFKLTDEKKITEKISKKTKAILLCNPSNPTGTIFSKKELEKIVNIAEKNKLFIITDEVYREFIFNGTNYTSVMRFNKIKE